LYFYVLLLIFVGLFAMNNTACSVYVNDNVTNEGDECNITVVILFELILFIYKIKIFNVS
jgi:multisubunit Na+/H+ antiporter MnhB subunit